MTVPRRDFVGLSAVAGLSMLGRGQGRPAAVPDDLVAIGEIGLGGELRQAGQTPRRLAEAARLGFARAVVPTTTPEVEGIALLRVGSVVEALDAAGLLADDG